MVEKREFAVQKTSASHESESQDGPWDHETCRRFCSRKFSLNWTNMLNSFKSCFVLDCENLAMLSESQNSCYSRIQQLLESNKKIIMGKWNMKHFQHLFSFIILYYVETCHGELSWNFSIFSVISYISSSEHNKNSTIKQIWSSKIQFVCYVLYSFSSARLSKIIYEDKFFPFLCCFSHEEWRRQRKKCSKTTTRWW